MPQLPVVERIFCCFPLTVGAFMIALGTLTMAGVKLSLIFLNEHTCELFQEQYLMYTTLVNTRYFCDEPPEAYEALFRLEIFLNGGMLLVGLCLLFGALFASRVLTGIYLYWAGICNFLRGVSYMVNIIPLYKTYTEQDFHIMLWGPIFAFGTGYCWLASYSFMESIPIPLKNKK